MDKAIDNLIWLMKKGNELLQELVISTCLEANNVQKIVHLSMRLDLKSQERVKAIEQLQSLRQTLDNEVKSQPQSEDEESSEEEKLRDLDNQTIQRILKLKKELELGRHVKSKKPCIDKLQEDIEMVDSRIVDLVRAIGGDTGVVDVASVSKLLVLGKLHDRKIWKGMVQVMRDGLSRETRDTIISLAEELEIVANPAEPGGFEGTTELNL